MKAIPLAISEFAVPAPRTGSIETYSGYGALPMVGSEIHALVQIQRQKDFPGYQPERWVTHGFNFEGNRINVSGRMDGFLSGTPSWIEEIKSAYNPDQLLKALERNPDHPYRLQALTYAYIHFKHTGEIPRVTLHLVSSRTKQGFDFELQLDVAHYEAWLLRRLEEIVTEQKMFKKLQARRVKSATSFAFPFAEPRRGQVELMQKVEECVGAKKKALLVQAPTGLGKTAGVLFPVLKEAFARGQKVIYLTPKNSQHAVAEDAVRRLQTTGTKVKAVTIQAKTKMCLKEQVLCNPEYCEFARDYYKKVADNGLIEKVAKKKNMTSRTFQKIGREYQVCPAELQMDSLARADVVICDYNYVFSPRNSLAKLCNNGFEKKTQPALVIDEVHNLPQRAADYFSAAISTSELLELQKGFSHLSEDLYRSAQELFREGRQLIETAGAGARKPVQVELNKERFLEFGTRVSGFLASYLESPAQLQLADSVLKFCNQWLDFLQALENLTDEFFSTFTPSPTGGTLKITCCDASAHLLEGYSAFDGVVAFSATVKPFDYYSKLLGLNQKPLETAEFFSPFPKEHRKLLIVPQVSTKYSDREANYPKIREGIARIVALKPGNYFVFFPSFEFLRRVAEGLELPNFEILLQSREMKRSDVNAYLEKLKNPDQPTLILAVQGGVFAEGVDYPGDMLIGAIVVGPALPTFDFERELLRGYYAKKHGEENGFDYAYTYPAMAKVVQSAGRVIRSHEDRGLIVLMDRRFVHESYVKSMPADWVGDDPYSQVSQSLLSDIRRFWDENDAQA